MSEAEILQVIKEGNLLFATEIINLLRLKNTPIKQCPSCNTKDNIRKHETIGRKQVYFCKNCNRYFTLEKDDDSFYEYVRKRLKQMRKYEEIGFILITSENKVQLSKKYPKIKERLNNGTLRRNCYLYYAI